MLAERDAMRCDLQILERCYAHLMSGDSKEKNLLEAYKYVFSRSSDWAGPLNYFRNLPYYRIRDDVSTVQAPVLLITGMLNFNLLTLPSIHFTIILILFILIRNKTIKYFRQS